MRTNNWTGNIRRSGLPSSRTSPIANSSYHLRIGYQDRMYWFPLGSGSFYRRFCLDPSRLAGC